MSLAEKFTGLSLRENLPIMLVGLGHGGTHWVAATFYIVLPAVSVSLGLSYTETGLLVSILHVSSFAANFFSGPLTDITGRHILLQTCALLAGAAALAGFVIAPGFFALAALITIIGVTNNLWHPPAISFLSTAFPANRGYALSIHALGANLGDAVAPITAGLLLTAAGWRQTTVLNSVPVIVIALLIAVFLARSAGRDKRPETQSRAGLSLGHYLSGMRQVCANHAVLKLCLMSAFRSTTQAGLLMFLPLYLANVIGASPLMMGLTLAAMQIGGMIASPVAGVWSDRVGRRPVVLAGLTVSTVTIVVLTLIGSDLVFIAGVAVLGFALYAVRPVVHSWMMDLTPHELGGSATSLMFGAQAGLSTLMPIVGGMIADSYGLLWVFYVLAGSMLVTNLLVLTLPRGAPARAP
ncbi:MAG: MFS transporter [Thalassobaculaceae bacterium]